MIGAGFIADMNKKLQQNRELLKRKNLFERGSTPASKRNKTVPKEKPADPAIIKKLIAKAEKDNKRELFLKLLKLITIMALIFLAFYVFIFLMVKLN